MRLIINRQENRRKKALISKKKLKISKLLINENKIFRKNFSCEKKTEIEIETNISEAAAERQKMAEREMRYYF